MKIVWMGTGTKIPDDEVSGMAEDKLLIREFTIGASHLVSTGPYENFRVEASISCGSKVGATDDEFRETMKHAQTKLAEILKQTFIEQRWKKKEQ